MLKYLGILALGLAIGGFGGFWFHASQPPDWDMLELTPLSGS